MIKILKILYGYNKISIHENKVNANRKKMIKFAKEFQIKSKITNELEYFQLKIIHQSLLNKLAFEQVFEDERHALLEMWDYLSYQERNQLINIKLNEIKNDYPFIKTENQKIIWIVFFDELLNSLYHKDIAILELPQYFKLYRQFRDKMIDINAYGLLPYQQRFIDVSVVDTSKEKVWFYSNEFRSLFMLSKDFKLIRISLSKNKTDVHPLKKDLLALSKAYEDSDCFLESLVNSPLIHEKAKIKIKKILTKSYGTKA